MLLAILTLMTMALAPWWGCAIYESLALLIQQEQGAAPKALAFWGWLTIACTLEVPGNFLLLRSIQRTDLSIFGPLSSYKPIVGMLLGWWILAEVPTVFGLLGMGIVLGGSLLLADPTRSSNKAGSSHANFWNSGVVDRLLAVALTAAGSIFLKLSMKSQNTLTSLAAWCFVSWLLAFAWLLVQAQMRGAQRTFVAPRFIRVAMQREVIGIAANMIAMQGLTIVVFQAMHVGYALALFQLGSLLSVYLGHRLFGEVGLWRRLLAASIMFVGAALIVLAGLRPVGDQEQSEIDNLETEAKEVENFESEFRVVALKDLDSRQVEDFAKAKGIDNCGLLLDAIERWQLQNAPMNADVASFRKSS